MNKINVIRSARVVSAGTAVSRLLGLVREILMAIFFGTSLARSAFTVAFTIPNLFRRLFGEGALSAAFVPVFAESLEKDGRDKAWEFARRIITLLTVTLVTVVILGIVLVTVLMVFFPVASKGILVLSLLKIMLPYMLFICLAALSMAILNSFGHFAVPAATPILLNVVWIASLVFICPLFGTTLEARIGGLAWSILAAGVIQLLVQFPVLKRYGYRPGFSLAWRKDERVLHVLRLMGPAALGMGVFQINVMIDRLLAFAVADWAAAALVYSERLIHLPLGLFATAMGTVLLPAFSLQAVQSDWDEMKNTINLSVRNLMLVTVPAAIGLFVLARPIVRLMFEWRGGAFDAESTVQTARALMFYAPGLVVFSFYKILVPAFYALKDTRTPVRVGMWVVGLNLVLNIIVVITWRLEFKHAGMALATVVASAVNCGILAWLLHGRIGSLEWRRIAESVGRIVVISIVMGVVVHFAHGVLEGAAGRLDVAQKLGQLLVVLGSVLLGLFSYGCLAGLLCRNELKEIGSALRRR